MPPDAGETFLTKHCVVMVWFLRELIDVVLCCIPTQSRKRSRNQNNLTRCHDAAFEKMLDPITGSPAAGKSVAGIIDLFADDLLGTGGTEMEQHVLDRRRKDFQVGSEDWNDVTYTGQRIRWTKNSQPGSCIEVSQRKAIDE